MILETQAAHLLNVFGGMFTTKQALDEGVSNTALGRMVRNKLIERVGPGVYSNPDGFEDEFLLAQMRFNSGIFCRETALYLYNLTDRTPNFMEMTFPWGYNNSKLEELRIVPYYQIPSLINMGVTTVTTPYGNQVKTFDMDRTICDIVRAPHASDDETIKNAMQAYVMRPEKNLLNLMKYAKALRVENKIQEDIGVLL